MNWKVLFILLVNIGGLSAIEKFVVVEVPCYAKNSAGECTLWAGIVQGCKGPCTINYKIGNITASCRAAAGNPCSAVLPFTPLLPRGINLPTVDTTHVKIPCISQNADGECIRWGSINQGCKAPKGGECKTNLNYKDKHAECNAKSEASCNSNIRIQLP